MKKTICVLNKANRPDIKKTEQIIKEYFKKKNYQILAKLNKLALKKKINFVMVLGGDGAMLHVANQLAPYNIPLVGVNFGYKGYLCQIQPDNLLKSLGRLNSEDYQVDSYTRIKAIITRNKRMIKEIDALNEIVVGGINRAVWLKMKIGQGIHKKTARVIGDGIIFSTQIGSTAYNMYAGGPVLLTDVFSVVPCNALVESDYFLSNTKSFIVPTSTKFEVKAIRGGDHLPYVIADGQRDYRLQKGDQVTITRSNLSAKMIYLK